MHTRDSRRRRHSRLFDVDVRYSNLVPPKSDFSARNALRWVVRITEQENRKVGVAHHQFRPDLKPDLDAIFNDFEFKYSTLSDGERSRSLLRYIHKLVSEHLPSSIAIDHQPSSITDEHQPSSFAEEHRLLSVADNHPPPSSSPDITIESPSTVTIYENSDVTIPTPRIRTSSARFNTPPDAHADEYADKHVYLRMAQRIRFLKFLVLEWPIER